MRQSVFNLFLSVSIPSAIYVLLMSTDGFDSAYWIAVTLYSAIWFLILGLPILLLLKKHEKLTVVNLSMLGCGSAILSLAIPHLKDLYLAKMSSLTLQEGQNPIFKDGVITEFGLGHLYSGLAFAALCGLMGGVIFWVLRRNRVRNIGT